MSQFEQINIKELLPQRDPFIMVGQLLYFDMEKTFVKTIITENNLFVDNGFFTQEGLIENIAQTCAARIGYINKYILKKAIQIGFIGAIKNLKIFRLPEIGETIVTKINVVEEIFGMILVNAVIKSGEETITEAEMKIALKKA